MNAIIITIVIVVVVGVVVWAATQSKNTQQNGSAFVYGSISACTTCTGTVNGLPCPVYQKGGCQPPCKCATQTQNGSAFAQVCETCTGTVNGFPCPVYQKGGCQPPCKCAN